MTDYHGRTPVWPNEGSCFLCNQQIDFFAQDKWDLSLSFLDAPRGASRPGRLFYAHHSCIERAAHQDYPVDSNST